MTDGTPQIAKNIKLHGAHDDILNIKMKDRPLKSCCAAELMSGASNGGCGAISRVPPVLAVHSVPTISVSYFEMSHTSKVTKLISRAEETWIIVRLGKKSSRVDNSFIFRFKLYKTLICH